jgi:hypothetical protein
MYTHRHLGERDHPASVNQASATITRDSVRRGAGPLGAGLPLDAVALVIAIIFAGILLRALVAGVILPLSGFRIDVTDFTLWGQRLATHGPGEFYAPGLFTDYPPGYLYVLWLLGTIGRELQPLLGADITRGLVKIPGILADGAIAWVLFDYSRRFLDGCFGGIAGERIGLVAAVVYLFNPGTFFDSSVWGQVDSVGTLAVLASLYWLARGWTEAAAIGAVLAVLIKYQFGILLPVVAVVGVKRHLLGRSSDPAHDGRPDPLRVLTSLAAGLGSMVLLILPYRLTIWAPSDPEHSLINKFSVAANFYQGLSLNAFNLWNNPWSGIGFQRWGCDAPGNELCGANQGTAFLLGNTSVSWQAVGNILFAAAVLAALWQIARRDDPAGVLRGTLLIAVAFFALPTRVHERYLFPALALAAPLVLRSWRWAVLYATLSFVFFANVYWVYTGDWSYVGGPTMNPGVNGVAMARDPVLQGLLYSKEVINVISAMVVVACGLLVWRAIRDGLAPAHGRAPAADRVERGPPGAYDEAPRPIDRFRRWLHPDPADPYLREPPRRLDRLDLALVVGLVLFSFVFRFWRIDQPPSACCFDEIYHARSATEWLSDWEHRWTRDVYEWTHPMLAKYLIAAGIVVANPNQVTGTLDLDAPANALAVAPQRRAFGHPESVLFEADGSQITARDTLTRESLASWQASGAVASLAYDEDQDRLLVGLAESGEVAVYPLATFMSAAGPRAPPSAAGSIATGLSSVLEIVVPQGQSVVLFRGADGIAEVESVTGAPLASRGMAVGGIGYVAGTGGGVSSPRVVATDVQAGRLAILDAATLQPVRTSSPTNRFRSLPAEPIGPLVVRGDGNDQQVYVPVAALPADDEHGPVDGGITVFDDSLTEIDTAPLPGRPLLIGWQPLSNIIYVAGDDTALDGPAVWAVQPLGNPDPQSAGFATFDTTALPGEPVALAFDTSEHDQDDDHGLMLLATEADGTAKLVAIDAGSNVVAWRLAGIVFGSILVGLVYLLAATMFRRRQIAVLAGAFMAVDAMSYVMSRIAMNDMFAVTFIVAAYLLFWQVWSGRWARSAWWVLPLVGVLIGLAAATKWVGIYALLGLWVLVLARSALGRLLLVVTIALITVVMGIGSPWPFLAICVATLLLAAVIVWDRPIRLGMEDLIGGASTMLVVAGLGLGFALALDQVPGAQEPRGAVELVFAVLARGAQVGWPAWLMLGVGAVLLVARAIVSLRRPESERRWHLPGALGGFAWPWVGACLAIIPLLIYFLAYVPYLQLGHSIAGPDAGPGYGWSLESLHRQMFGYHFGLTAGHVASSPWWSWPLDLKPVWFYGSPELDGRRLAMVYNGGNPILFWAGIPALVWCGLQAWRRRSTALVLLVIAFAFQFLPWSRVERATFQYHYLSALPFAMVAVAYALDELLRSWTYRPLAIGFLVLAAIAGVLIFPLGSALAMPDWYINGARALVPWNYAFQFPSPPAGQRAALISFSIPQLAAGTLAALAAATFALFGRQLLLFPPPQRDHQQEYAENDQADGPQQVGVEGGQVLADEEVDPQPDEDQPEDHRPGG